MSSSLAEMLQSPTNGSTNGTDGKKRKPCPLYGCKRVYTDMSALDSHVKDHQIPSHSLPGKVFLCSTIGCSGSFPNMQHLMEHMRHHHKPNIFFLCENCRAKLRSYRGLLTHLHACSKVPRGKMKAVEPMDTQPAPEAKPSTSPVAADPSSSTDQSTPTHDSSAVPMPLSSHIQTTDSAAAAPPSQPDSAATPTSHPPYSSDQKPSSAQLSLQQATEAASHSQPRPEASYPPPASLSWDTQTLAPAPPQPQVQPDPQSQPQPSTRSPQPVHPAPVSSPQSPPGSTAVWRKNQGLAIKSRILWEHTRGQYRCVQCGHSVPTRREMTAHINTQHRNPPPSKPTGDRAGTSAGGEIEKPVIVTKKEEEKTVDMKPLICGVTIPKKLMGLLSSSSSYKKMTRDLMEVVFSREEMATSSVTGRRSNTTINAVAKPALPSDKLDAIIAYVQDHFKDVETVAIKKVMSYKLKDIAKQQKLKR